MFLLLVLTLPNFALFAFVLSFPVQQRHGNRYNMPGVYNVYNGADIYGAMISCHFSKRKCDATISVRVPCNAREWCRLSEHHAMPESGAD